ncbi:hypothetical protein ACIHFD_49155 [Nonomuraea sp. NPDC051941]|uniref:hypothetical protein n=1 Tax=Nonomuraea sp. NPDC051941 TaxID=3364373 RepID=UPI0037C771E8
MIGGSVPTLYVIGVNVALIVVLAMLCDARRNVRNLRRETKRLQARLETYHRILAPLPDAVRADQALRIPPADMAVLALLIEQAGPDGDELAALERMFHQKSEHDHGLEQ